MLTILRTAMDGYWMVNAHGRLMEVNDTACQLLGYSRDELLAMSISDVEAVESPEETAARIQTVMRAGADRFVTRHRRKDGVVLDVEVSATYLPLYGGRFFVFVRDVTERKRMEEALKDSKRWVEEELARRTGELDESERRYQLVATAVDQAPVSVVIADPGGRIEYRTAQPPAVHRSRGPADALAQRRAADDRADPARYRAAADRQRNAGTSRRRRDAAARCAAARARIPRHGLHRSHRRGWLWRGHPRNPGHRGDRAHRREPGPCLFRRAVPGR